MNQGTMSHKSLSLKTAAVFVASTLMLGACSSNSSKSLQDGAAQDEELSPQQKLENEGGVKIDPGIASCEFNNELEDHHADGSGVSPYPALDRAELREEEDAYVVTFTGDFFDPEVLLVPDSKVSLQLILSVENLTDISPSLMKVFRIVDVDWTGNLFDQY